MRALAAADEPPRIAIRGRAPLRLAPETPPLIAMPTTAGTGAEVTPFSAIYIDGVKHALDDPAVAPDEAIVDPELTAGMPRALAASTGADALCQAVESYWSVRSTEESRALAGRSIELVLAHLASAVSAPSAMARAGMSRAALDAGRAIAITRTTAPHAVSYALAARGDFAHGQACALTLPAFFLFTSEVNDDDVNDPRGAAFVRERVLELTWIIGASDASSAAARLSALFDSIGLATHLDARSMAGHIASISSAVDASRAGNHPRRVTSEVVSSILISLCEGRA